MVAASIVIDTNVFITALRSRRGASFRLLSLVGIDRRIVVSFSVPLILEYEAVAKRLSRSLGLTHSDIEDAIDYLCSVAQLCNVFYLWRPTLRDPGDEMVLELAASAGCDAIVTYNAADYSEARRFGIDVLSPMAFLQNIGEIP